MSLQIILFQPEIPQNTGNIGRLSVALNVPLHLIKPLGFSLDDRYLKRAGLDYWEHVDLHIWENWAHFRQNHPTLPLHYFTTKATQTLWDVTLPPDCGLVFGPESRGLPEPMWNAQPANAVRLPMSQGPIRSLNLSVAVGIASYEHARRYPQNLS